MTVGYFWKKFFLDREQPVKREVLSAYGRS